MRTKDKQIYAIYDNDEFIDMGTADELSKRQGITKNTIYSSFTPKRRENIKNKRREYIKIEKEEKESIKKKEKTYSKKNLIGKIARKIYELNEHSSWSFILDENSYSLWNRGKELWLNGCTELTADNLQETLNELNRIDKFEGGKQ